MSVVDSRPPDGAITDQTGDGIGESRSELDVNTESGSEEGILLEVGPVVHETSECGHISGESDTLEYTDKEEPSPAVMHSPWDCGSGGGTWNLENSLESESDFLYTHKNKLCECIFYSRLNCVRGDILLRS